MAFILKSHNVEKKGQSSFRRKECNGDRLNKKRTINQFYVTSLNNCPEGTIIVTLLTKKRMKVIDHKTNGIRSWRRSFVSFLHCFDFWRWICYKVTVICYYSRIKNALNCVFRMNVMTPSVMVTIYFGADEWTGLMSLFDMIEGEEPRVVACMNNYKLQLIAPAQMSDEEIMKIAGKGWGAMAHNGSVELLLTQMRALAEFC